MPAAGGRVFHVYPIGWKGPMQQPAFIGLMRAYNMGSSASDHDHTFPPRVHPGDMILVHAGLYISDRFHYMNGLPHPGLQRIWPSVTDGTYYLTQSGTPDKPIVIKGGGRRRSDLRRRGRGQSLQPAARQLQLFRRHHGAQHHRRLPAGLEGHCRLQRLHPEAQPHL